YVAPDMRGWDQLAATRIQRQSDIWRFPVTGKPAENVRNSTRITHQTGLAQTPSASPDGKEVVYLADSGGHGNLWVARSDGSASRQITFEHDPAITVGAPVWSPAGDWIVFVETKPGSAKEWLVHPDGSGLHQILSDGVACNWSGDG